MVAPSGDGQIGDRDRKPFDLGNTRAALPVDIASVSLGEGQDAVGGAELRRRSLHFIIEIVAPTSSSRIAACVRSTAYLRQLGLLVLEDHSRQWWSCGRRFWCRHRSQGAHPVPESTQAAKVAQMRAFGADVHLVAGARERSRKRQSGSRRKSSMRATIGSRSFFRERSSWHMNCGKILASGRPTTSSFRRGLAATYWLGASSSELLAAGHVARRQASLCAQPANCAPIDASFMAGADDLVPVETRPTIAEGTAIKKPYASGRSSMRSVARAA